MFVRLSNSVLVAVLLARLCNGARIKSHVHLSRNDSMIGNATARLWSWNAPFKDVKAQREVVERLFARNEDDHGWGNPDILVTCQQEAQFSVKEAFQKNAERLGLRGRWTLASHAEHWGMAGGHRNAQILSVFLKGNRVVFGDGPKRMEGKGSFVAGWHADVLMASSKSPGYVTIETQLHQTSPTGKGGASARITFDKSFIKTSADVTVTVSCAHLDSEADSKRLSGLVRILGDATGLNGKKWSYAPKYCNFLEGIGGDCGAKVARPRSPVSASLILGDLNYRLLYKNKNKEKYDIWPEKQQMKSPDDNSNKRMAHFIFSQSGRHRMSFYDPLNPEGLESDGLVNKQIAHGMPLGFGFECNRPYTRVLPTYKRSAGEPCGILGKTLDRCREIIQLLIPNDSTSVVLAANQSLPQECLKEHLERLVLGCYSAKNSWGTKDNEDMAKRYLQLGWLDRVCFVTASHSPVQVRILDNRGWNSMIGSDHSPVESLVSFSSDRCSIHVVANPAAFSANSSQSLKLPMFVGGIGEFVHPGELAEAHCPEGYRIGMRAANNGYYSHPADSSTKQTLECINGKLLTPDGVHAEELSCLRYCGPPLMGKHASREDFPAKLHGDFETMGVNFVAGAYSRYRCKPGYMHPEKDEFVVTCQDDGKYDFEAPVCLALCDVPDPGKHGAVTTETTPTTPKPRIKEDAHGLQPKVFERTKFHFACDEGCVLVGVDEVMCKDGINVQEHVPTCVCHAKISIGDVVVSGIASVDHLRFSAFSYKSLGQPALIEELIPIASLGGEGFVTKALVVREDLAQTFFKLDACSMASKGRESSGKCHTVASSTPAAFAMHSPKGGGAFLQCSLCVATMVFKAFLNPLQNKSTNMNYDIIQRGPQVFDHIEAVEGQNVPASAKATFKIALTPY